MALAQTDSDLPIGLWIWEADEASPKRTVAIDRHKGTWRAVVNGEPVFAREADEVLRFALPSGETFSAALPRNGAPIEGLWIQPASRLGYGRMATPFRLAAEGRRKWGGGMLLQARPYRVFLEVFENEEGEAFAALRNPERNEYARFPRFRMEHQDKDTWLFKAGDETRTELRRGQDDTWLLTYDPLGQALPLRLAEGEAAEGYVPWSRSLGSAGYTPPALLDDGWEVIDAGDVGFDPDALSAMVAEIAASDPKAIRPRLIHSVLAARHGKLFLEEYFYSHDAEDRHDTRSLAKAFAPLLIGALRNDGVDIDAEVRPLPAVLAAAGEELGDPRKADVTLGHLMSFTSGLACNDNDETSPGNENTLWDQREEPDFWLYTARLPMVYEPGTRHAYCSASINLAGASIVSAGGKPIIELFDELIAKPLNFGPYHWNLAPNGAAYLGGGVYLRPRDILKIGVLYTEEGRWKEEQIIDPDWVRQSTSPQIAITPQTTGMSQEEFANNSFGGVQAYKWRLDEVLTAERSYLSYETSGNGGQLLVIVPELGLTVLFTGGNYFRGGIWGRWRDEIIGGHIIPALKEVR
jgi:CubicO group peptidase (beta-lactamase class C family)